MHAKDEISISILASYGNFYIAIWGWLRILSSAVKRNSLIAIQMFIHCNNNLMISEMTWMVCRYMTTDWYRGQ